jgi:hypothetical protein
MRRPLKAAFKAKRSAANRRATGSALARFETRVALADHEHFAAATDDFTVAVTLLC